MVRRGAWRGGLTYVLTAGETMQTIDTLVTELAQAEQRSAALEAALVEERATAILLRDELENYRPRVWPTRRETFYLRHAAHDELVAEGLLPRESPA